MIIWNQNKLEGDNEWMIGMSIIVWIVICARTARGLNGRKCIAAIVKDVALIEGDNDGE